MSPRLPVRSIAHRGRVRAHGLLLDKALASSAWVAQIASLLAPGDRLLESGELVFIQLAAPRSLRAELAPATPVVHAHGYFCALPLSRDEAAALGAPVGALLFMQAGRLCALDLAELKPCRPQHWLELGEVTQLEVVSLGAAPARIAEPPRAEPLDVRKTLGVPALSELEQAELLRVEQAAGLREARGPSVLSRVAGSLRGFAGGAALGQGVGLGWSLRLLSGWLARALITLHAARLWMWPHGRYLRKLEALFERGDTLEALRRALPLGGSNPGAREQLALLPPGRRAELSLAGSDASITNVLPLDAAWREHLRKLYERAFEQLKRAGNVEHAAFVLAVLLNDVPRAIQWLESEQQLRLAAELAESRKAPVGERVRLWFLAGETQRAIDLALRFGAFADAVQRLETRDQKKAAALRLVWADRLAAAGDYLEAALVAWSVPQGDTLISRWLGLASGDDGPRGQRAWLARLSREPALLGTSQAALAPALEATHEDAASARAQLARDLVRYPRNAALDALTTPLLRSLLRDTLYSQSSCASPTELRALLERAPVLEADLPRPAAPSRPTLRDLSLRRLSLPSHERGSTPVYDVLALPGGRSLVALGELGVKLLGRQGNTLVHWSREPVHALVPSPSGHVITLSGRSAVKRVGRLDLATRRLTRWLDLELQNWAESFDGMGWYVQPVSTTRTQLVCLDALDAGARSAWQVDVPGAIVQLHVSDKSCDLVCASSELYELWSYELPESRLRSRSDFQFGPSALAGEGRSLHVVYKERPELALWQHGKLQWSRSLPATLELGAPPEGWPDAVFAVWACWPWLCLAQPTEAGMKLDVLQLALDRHWNQVLLAGAQAVQARFCEATLVICDDLGRVVRIGLERGDHALLRV